MAREYQYLEGRDQKPCYEWAPLCEYTGPLQRGRVPSIAQRPSLNAGELPDRGAGEEAEPL